MTTRKPAFLGVDFAGMEKHMAAAMGITPPPDLVQCQAESPGPYQIQRGEMRPRCEKRSEVLLWDWIEVGRVTSHVHDEIVIEPGGARALLMVAFCPWCARRLRAVYVNQGRRLCHQGGMFNELVAAYRLGGPEAMALILANLAPGYVPNWTRLYQVRPP